MFVCVCASVVGVLELFLLHLPGRRTKVREAPGGGSRTGSEFSTISADKDGNIIL